MSGVELRVLFVGSKRSCRQAGPCAQHLEQGRRRRKAFHDGDEAEERDRMVMFYPVILGADELRDSRGRHPPKHGISLQTEGLEIFEQGNVMAFLFGDVLI